MPETGGIVAVFSGGGTGGHLYPALTLAERLGRLRPDVRSFFVGAERGLEARVLRERGLPHVLLPVRGLERRALRENVGVLYALLRALVRTAGVFRRLQPRVVVVTGGYAGGPAGLAAGMMGIPLALQEQNSVPGLTTRVLSRWARQVHLAFPEAVEHLPRGARPRARVSGNPIREPPGISREAARRLLGLPVEGDLLLVVGGSQGAEALNRALLEAVWRVAAGDLPRPPGLHVLWATGPAHLEGIREALEGAGSPGWVSPVGYIERMPEALTAATLAVSRAGAMATSEFLAWGLPAILVPLPTAAAGHQARNAETLERAGAARHLPQDRLNGPVLWDLVVELLSDREGLRAMSEAARARGRPAAAREIAAEIAALLPPPPPGGTGTAAGRTP